MLSNEIQFNQYEGGYWIATHMNVVLWVAPNTEEIQFYEVPDSEQGYTFGDLTSSTQFDLKVAVNDEGDQIAFFIDPLKNTRFALVFNDTDRSEWGSIPAFEDSFEEEA